jgi:hypothetical protein
MLSPEDNDEPTKYRLSTRTISASRPTPQAQTLQQNPTGRQAAEVAIAVGALNRMLKPGRLAQLMLISPMSIKTISMSRIGLRSGPRV